MRLAVYFLVGRLLLGKNLNNLSHLLLLLIIPKITHTIDALCRPGRFEMTEHAVCCHAPGVVMFQIFLIPFQYCFIQ